ncbi:MAG: autotransporter domain-containing protein [Usitatibacter sp.]
MKKRVLPALLLSMFAGAMAPSASAQLAHFSGVYSFGDSLSDAGYYRPFLLSLGIPPATVAQLGRFTTNPGPVFTESLSNFYGVTPGPSNANGGNIFAQGGARVADPSPLTPTGAAQRPVSTQITEYLARGNGAADPGALYTVWAGANDIFVNLGALQAGAINATQLQTNVLAAATAEITQIARLRAAGARYIMVFGLPDIGGTPQFAAADPVTRGSVTALSAGYNTTLFSGLAGAGIRVIPVDSFSLLAEVKANPSAYGFTNVTQPACGPFPPITTASTVSSQFCLVGVNLVAPNAQNTYLFADGVHPTTAAQAIIAQFAESLIEGPTAYSILPEAVLRTRDAHIRTINDGIVAGSNADIGRITVFAAGDHGTFDLDPGADRTNSSGSIGVTARVSDGVTVGAAVGKSTSSGSFGANLGNFKTDETLFSAFATVQSGGLYGTAIASISNIKFNDTSRNIVLGPLVRTATSQPDGSNASFFATLGYDFSVGRFRVGPLVSFNSQNVTVNQFDEDGAGSANLRIGGQTRRSEVWSVGARASFEMGGWTPWIRVTADSEHKDDARFVTAMPLSLIGTGNSYDVAAIKTDSSYFTGSIGIRGTIMQRIGVSLAYYKVSGRSGIKEDGVGGLLSYQF